MKVIRYTLLNNGKVPSSIVDGGYFVKFNGGESPQDYDLIGFSLDLEGLEFYTTKTKLGNYIKSFMTDYEDEKGKLILIQDEIDKIWNRSLL